MKHIGHIVWDIVCWAIAMTLFVVPFVGTMLCVIFYNNSSCAIVTAVAALGAGVAVYGLINSIKNYRAMLRERWFAGK